MSDEFTSDDDALELLKTYGHEEARNGVIQGDWRSFDARCRRAVQYLCDEWDFVFEDTAVAEKVRSMSTKTKIWDFWYGEKRGHVTPEDFAAFLQGLPEDDQAEIDHLRSRKNAAEAAVELAISELEKKNALIRDLLAALAWYTNPEIYKPHPHGPAFDRRDLSSHAIDFLAKAKAAGYEP